MEEQEKLLQNNKGFSLVELLVAVAVGAIVLSMVMVFLTSGMNYFNKQSSSINLQNELQEATNAVTEAIMESNVIHAFTTDNGLLMVELDLLKTDSTGTVVKDEDGNYSFTGKNPAKAILFDPDQTTLYILDTNGYNKIMNPGSNASINMKGYAYSTYVVGMRIAQGEGDNMRGSLVMDVTITVASTKTSSDRISDDLKITTRNAVTYTSTVQ